MIKCEEFCDEKDLDICCRECEFKDDCEGVCAMDPNECHRSIFTEIQSFENTQMVVIEKITDIITKKKELEKQEKNLKEKLKTAMEKYNIKKFESDFLNITYVAETTATSIDSAKLKKKYPEIADECSKISDRSAYVKVTVK